MSLIFSPNYDLEHKILATPVISAHLVSKYSPPNTPSCVISPFQKICYRHPSQSNVFS